MDKDIELDSVDKEILNLLFQDGRMTLTELGEKISCVKGSSLSHVAIRNRLEKLVPLITRIQANLDLGALNYSSVYLLIETKDYDTQRKLIEKSRLCPRIASIELLSGKFNIIMRIVASTFQDIDCFIFSVIQKDDMIRSFEILHCRKQIKPKYLPLKLPSFQRKLHPRTPCGLNCAFCGMYKDGTCQGCPGSHYSEKKYSEILDDSSKNQ